MIIRKGDAEIERIARAGDLFFSLSTLVGCTSATWNAATVSTCTTVTATTPRTRPSSPTTASQCVATTFRAST